MKCERYTSLQVWGEHHSWHLMAGTSLTELGSSPPCTSFLPWVPLPPVLSVFSGSVLAHWADWTCPLQAVSSLLMVWGAHNPSCLNSQPHPRPAHWPFRSLLLHAHEGPLLSKTPHCQTHSASIFSVRGTTSHSLLSPSLDLELITNTFSLTL